jgi:heparanase 1
MQAFALPFQAAAKAANITDVRVGETAAVNHGGWDNVTDGYVSGFWSVYQLGWLAQAGFKAMQRQTIACGPKYRNGGGVYGLLSEAPAYTPRPDYWTSLLWTKLMGPSVLQTRVNFTADGSQPSPPFATPKGLERTLRVYAHCTPTAGSGTTATTTTVRDSAMERGTKQGMERGYAKGAVTIAFANPQTFPVVLNLTGLSTASTSTASTPTANLDREEYRLVPLSSDATDEVNGLRGLKVALLGKGGARDTLEVAADGSLPSLEPVEVGAGTSLRLEPLTYGFIVLPNAAAAACL